MAAETTTVLAEGSRLTQSGAILSDLEILERLIADEERCIFVSPLIDPMVQLGPSSLDVRLGSKVTVTRAFSATHIDLTAAKEQVRGQVARYSEVRNVTSDAPFVLHPGEFALGETLEFLRLPKDIAARLEGRSSFGRLGIQVHATAGFVDPGFEGPLTFELMNSGRLPVRLKPGLRLAQLCFFPIHNVQVTYPDKPYTKYGGTLGVDLTRIDEDPEIPESR